MPPLQDWIHKLGAGAGSRVLKWILLLLVSAAVTIGYDLRSYKNFSTQEAMDTAQLARNIAEGKGYTTQFIRPFSMYLVNRKSQEAFGVSPTNAAVDNARIKEAHPDISNPPVFPLVLAGLMRVLPFDFTISAKTTPFWFNGNRFWRYEPEFLIALFNQLLFFIVLVSLFFLAKRLFDSAVAWASAILSLGTEAFWRFSVSGLSTMLLLLIFMGLVWCLVLLENETRRPVPGGMKMPGLAVAMGLLIGAGCLTRYAFGWMLIPTGIFLILFSGRRRNVLCLLMTAAFLAVTTPWMVRNYSVSGAPFGTATYTALKSTDIFPGHDLERSLEPNFATAYPVYFWLKLLGNARGILQQDFPKLAGSWAMPLFLVGLMIGFRNPATRRLRYFVLLSLAVLIVVQALGRTQLSDDSPEINSENLLVLLAPLVLMYAAGLFFLLLDQMNLPVVHLGPSMIQLRYLVMAGFGAILWLPMLSAATSPLTYPPYHPPVIQQTAGYMGTNELMMSDIPWAVAWYGDRQCAWLTLNVQPDFFALNNQKPVQALYLSQKTLANHSLADWIHSSTNSWENFTWHAIVNGEFSTAFPLREAPTGYFPDQIFLSDRQRW